MLTVINFSYPIPENRQDILDILGDEYKVIQVLVQVDQDASMVEEVKAIYEVAIEAAGGSLNIDTIILPGLAIVAVLLVARFRTYGYAPNVLRLAPVQDAVPPRFEAVELIKSYLL